MVLLMLSKVVRYFADPLRQERNLDISRARILRTLLEPLQQLFFLRLVQLLRHLNVLTALFSFFRGKYSTGG